MCAVCASYLLAWHPVVYLPSDRIYIHLPGYNYNPNLSLASFTSENLGYNIPKLLSYCINPYFTTLSLLKVFQSSTKLWSEFRGSNSKQTQQFTKFSDIKDLTVG